MGSLFQIMPQTLFVIAISSSVLWNHTHINRKLLLHTITSLQLK